MLSMVPMPASAAEAAHMNGGPPQQPQYDTPYESEPPSYQQYDVPPYAEQHAQQPYSSAPMQTEYAYGGGDGYSGSTPQYDSSAPDYVPPPQGYDAAQSGGYGQQGPEGSGQQQHYGFDPRQQQPVAAAAAASNSGHPHMSQQAPYSPPPQASAPQQPQQQQPQAQAATPGQPAPDPEQQKGACRRMS